MESGGIKVCQTEARKVAQDVLRSVWYKQEVIQTKTKFTFQPEILINLCDLVSIEMVRNEYVWEDFLKNFRHRMIRTPYRFSNYFAYASYILFEEDKDAHACFIDILALVTHFTLHCWQKTTDDERFLNLCVDLFCAFFDKELCEKFEHQGGWKNFNEYLKKQDILKRYREQTRPDQMNQIFLEFQTRHESNEPYVINNVVLKEITHEMVENDEKAVRFADSVGNQMKEVFNKEFKEILKDFQKIDRQFEELRKETVGETSDEVTSSQNQSSMHEVKGNALKNVGSKIDKKDKDQNKEFKENVAFKEVLKDFPKIDSQNVPSKVNPKKGKGQSKKIKENTAIKEALKDFPKRDSQKEKQQREKVGVASVEMASGGDKSSQETQEAAEKIPIKSNGEKIEGNASDSRKTRDIDSLKPIDLSPAPKESDQSPKVTRLGRAKELSADSLKSCDLSAAPKESDTSPKLTKLEKALPDYMKSQDSSPAPKASGPSTKFEKFKAHFDSMKSQYLSQSPKELDTSPKLTKLERANKALHDSMKSQDSSPAPKASGPSTKFGRAEAHSDSIKSQYLSQSPKESDTSPKLTLLERANKALSDSMKSQDFYPDSKESDPSPNLTKLERAKAKLKEMLTDITKLAELIKFVCEDNAIEVQ